MNNKHIPETIQTQAVKVHPQYLTFLLMLYITLTLIGCPLLYKIFQIGFVVGVGGILPLPFVLLLEDVIAEVYGYKISRLMLWYLLFSMLLFIFGELWIVHLPSPSYWNHGAAFSVVFGGLAQGVPLMVFAVFCGRFLNLYVITKLKILVMGRYFWLRSVFSCLVGDLITLSILYSFGFPTLPFDAKAHLFLSDLFVRVTYSIVGGGIGVFVVRFLKKKEGIDVYDHLTNFNPFKLAIKNEDPTDNKAKIEAPN